MRNGSKLTIAAAALSMLVGSTAAAAAAVPASSAERLDGAERARSRPAPRRWVAPAPPLSAGRRPAAAAGRLRPPAGTGLSITGRGYPVRSVVRPDRVGADQHRVQHLAPIRRPDAATFIAGSGDPRGVLSRAMTDFATLIAADRGQTARTIHLVDKDGFADWLKRQPPEDRALLEAHRFDGKTASASPCFPAATSSRWWRRVEEPAGCRPGASPGSAESLPEGTYRLADGEPGPGRAWLAARPAPVRRIPLEAGRARAAGRACW